VVLARCTTTQIVVHQADSGMRTMIVRIDGEDKLVIRLPAEAARVLADLLGA
jgi:hypothetical protein